MTELDYAGRTDEQRAEEGLGTIADLKANARFYESLERRTRISDMTIRVAEALYVSRAASENRLMPNEAIRLARDFAVEFERFRDQADQPE